MKLTPQWRITESAAGALRVIELDIHINMGQRCLSSASPHISFAQSLVGLLAVLAIRIRTFHFLPVGVNLSIAPPPPILDRLSPPHFIMSSSSPCGNSPKEKRTTVETDDDIPVDASKTTIPVDDLPKLTPTEFRIWNRLSERK
jgi:hypothetical protein